MSLEPREKKQRRLSDRTPEILKKLKNVFLSKIKMPYAFLDLKKERGL